MQRAWYGQRIFPYFCLPVKKDKYGQKYAACNYKTALKTGN